MKHSTGSSGDSKLINIFVIKWFEPESSDFYAYQYQLSWEKCRYITDINWEKDLIVVEKLEVKKDSQEYNSGLRNSLQ